MVADDPTLPPRYVCENYRRAYKSLNGREPTVRYMGNHWYNVNGEIVYRSTLMEEIERLCKMAQRQHVRKIADKGVIQRLISRLRSL